MSTNRIKGWFNQNRRENARHESSSEGLEALRRRLEHSRQRYGEFLNAILMLPTDRDRPAQS